MVLYIGPLQICVQITKRPPRPRAEWPEWPVRPRTDPERLLEESRLKAMYWRAGRFW